MNKRIVSSTILKNEEFDIYYIVINTSERWTNYQINKYVENNKINITFFSDIETQPGMIEEWEDAEYIEIPNFNSHDYLITNCQEKDEIVIICIPERHLFNNFFKIISND